MHVTRKEIEEFIAEKVHSDSTQKEVDSIVDQIHALLRNQDTMKTFAKNNSIDCAINSSVRTVSRKRPLLHYGKR
jgi:hypothetical protein